ncbi:MAG: AMP-binding protein, partial [Bacteroidota bacterium]|nr:AMP-binding protein [Bacteroidota bacterium]
MIQENLLEYVENSIKNNWNISALSDYKGKPYSYSEVGELITGLHLFFDENGIQKGDKIALISNNSANWAVIFLAVVSYGGVIVPILSDFRPKDIHNIVTHSDAKLLFSSESVWKTLNIKKMKGLKSAFSVEDFTSLTAGDIKNTSKELFKEKFPNGIKPEEINFQEMKKDDLAVISYTSGTTGFSKGVMLSHNSLAANIRFAHRHMPLNPGDPILSLLTIAHVFGMVFDFLFPFTLGCHITFLTKIPSLPVLTQAYAEIQPRLILLVPLLMEKIYKNKLVPTIKKPIMKTLLKIPGLRQIIFKSINKKISAVFGGQFRELILGGAAFNQDAEKFFMQIKFPFTIGYGMTECAPLISYAPWNAHRPESCGKTVDTLEVKIDSDDPENIVGEIMVKGDNVMKGYYKNTEATESVLNKDGWLRTGD